MSTWFTQRGVRMVDSRSLRLVFAAADARAAIVGYVAAELRCLGHEDVSPPVLDFLGVLECGTNVASEVARSLGVSRQMVGKTVKELGRRGYLEQVDGPGRQKAIVFTERGERLMGEVRRVLADLDEKLGAGLGPDRLDDTLATLEAVDGLLGRSSRRDAR